MKSDQIIFNLAEDFCKAANQFFPSITTLFKKSGVILSEPSDIEEAQIISGTLKIHKFKQCLPTVTRETQINFFFLLNIKKPCCTQKCANKKRCRHVDHDFDCLVHFRSTGAYWRVV